GPKLVHLEQPVDAVAAPCPAGNDERGPLEVAQHPRRPAGSGGGSSDRQSVHRRDLNTSVSTKETVSSPCEPLGRRPSPEEVLLRPPVAPLARLQPLDHRPARRNGDPAPPRPLVVVCRLGEPRRVVRRPRLVAERVILRDRLGIDARKPKEQGNGQ